MNETLSGFEPNIAIPPGETIKDYLESLGMSQVDFSKRLGFTPKTVNEIINGKAPITAETALKLENIFGTPASFWNTLEVKYQEVKARIDAEKKIEEEIEIARMIPYSTLANMGFVQTSKIINNKVTNLRSFFAMGSLHYIPDIFPVAFRIEKDKASSLALATWIRIGEILASDIKTERYDENKLKLLIPFFRELTLQTSIEFHPKLIELCASCGVAFVLVPHLPKTYAHGVTKWLTPNKAVVQLSIRRSYVDIFWFSFFHEIGHILLHGKKQTFTEIGIKGKIEEEADYFAAEQLVPSKLYNLFISKRNISLSSILKFAESINIHPCIVVGKLQHDGFLDHSQLNHIRPKLIWKN